MERICSDSLKFVIEESEGDAHETQRDRYVYEEDGMFLTSPDRPRDRPSIKIEPSGDCHIMWPDINFLYAQRGE